MAQYLAEEHLNSEGELDKKTRRGTTQPILKKHRLKKKVKRDTIQEEKDAVADSSDDGDFTSGSSSSDSFADEELLTNVEVSGACFLQLVCSALILSSSSPMSFLPNQSHKLAVNLKGESVVVMVVVLLVLLLWRKLKTKIALNESLHGLNHR